MARKVFFSFHYQLDVVRAAQVRNSWVTKSDSGFPEFLDKASWERVRLGGDGAIKRWINQQLSGTSVTVVLIGSQTHKRPYVKYEIERSWELGHGLVGVYIHGMRTFDRQVSLKGRNPFDDYTVTVDGRKYEMTKYVETYDWQRDDGYENLGEWVERAARNAGY